MHLVQWRLLVRFMLVILSIVRRNFPPPIAIEEMESLTAELRKEAGLP